MTSFILRKGAAERTGTDAVVVGVLSSDKGPQLAPGGEGVAEAYGRKLKPLLSMLDLTGKAGQTATVPTGGTLKSAVLVLVGMGPEVTGTSVRRAAGAAARAVSNAASVSLALPTDEPGLVRAVVEGWSLGGYSFDAYRTRPSEDRPGEVVVLCQDARKAEFTRALEDAQVVVEAVACTRDWVNTPPGDLRPTAFADVVAKRGKERKRALGGKNGKGDKGDKK